MCGIAGIYHYKLKTPVLKEEIDLLTDAVAHRGPDGRGIWIDLEGYMALGHRRLSILDLSENGKQPMSYSDDRYWITYNGEVYNFLEIQDELSKKGYSFKSDSDTEIILAAYQEWGRGMLDRFNGMWAFAIYDVAEKSLFLSRDRFGIKPLYYFKDEERFIFSSEVQAIHKILGKKHPLNDLVIRDVVNGGFANHGTEETYLEGVKSLPGGFNLIMKDAEVGVEGWYTLKKVPVPESFERQAVELKKMLSDACGIRLRSDVPIGTCLSGGLDSGSVAAIINGSHSEMDARFDHYTHRGFCAAFPNTPIDESRAAQSLATVLKSDLDVVAIESPSKAELEMAMRQCDGPMHALAFFPIWALYRHIKRQGISVTLDGQGPDEMLGGYRPIYEALQAAIELRRPGWFLDIYKTYAAQGESAQFSSRWYARRVLVIILFQPIIVFLADIFSKIGFPKMKRDLDQFFSGSKPNSNFSRNSVNMTNAFDASLFRQFFCTPLPGILNQYDRCSMAHGVECRMPFMDYRIVEFIFSLPPESKVGNGYTKRILREAMRGLVPDETRLNKSKIGFNAPIVDWFHGPLKDFMLEQMNCEEFLDCKFIDGRVIRSDFEKFLQEDSPNWVDAWRFWPPVHLVWWLKNS